MRSLLIALLFCATPALAQEWRCDAQHGVMYQSSRVVQLPQDEGKLYCTIIGNPADPQVRQLVQWFSENQELRQVKQSTHFAVMSSDSTMFKARYDATTGELPCLRIQQADGTVIYQCSSRKLPLSAEALANSISTTCLRRRNVEPQPDISYHYHFTVPDEKPKPDTQPDVFIKEQSMFEIPVWAFVVLGIAAIFGGVGVEWAKEVKGRS